MKTILAVLVSAILAAGAFAQPDRPAFADARPADSPEEYSIVSKGAHGRVFKRVQADDKALIGGAITTVGVTGRKGIARLNQNGTRDDTFNPTPGANGNVLAVAVQPNNPADPNDDQVLIGGGFFAVNNQPRVGIARLNANGTLDTFNPGVNSAVYSIVVQSDGKILIGGEFTTVGGSGRNRIARLNDNGGLDTGFNPGVSGGASPVVYSVAVQANNFVLIGGDFTTVAGQTRNRVARLEADGDLDGNFNPDTPNGPVRSLALQQDGKVVIGGDFTTVGFFNRNRIARLNAGGTLDADFQNSLSGADAQVYSVAVQSDGKVLIGGAFTSVNGTARNQIGRLNGDGNLDDSFRPGPANQVSQYGPKHSDINITPYVRSVAIQADGLIVIGGEFTTYEVPGQNAQGNPQPLSADARIARIGGL